MIELRLSSANWCVQVAFISMLKVKQHWYQSLAEPELKVLKHSVENARLAGPAWS
jgi:hypothetical protein